MRRQNEDCPAKRSEEVGLKAIGRPAIFRIERYETPRNRLLGIVGRFGQATGDKSITLVTAQLGVISLHGYTPLLQRFESWK